MGSFLVVAILDNAKNGLTEIEEKNKETLLPTTPKANATISSSADTDAVDDDDLGSFGTCGKPH